MAASAAATVVVHSLDASTSPPVQRVGMRYGDSKTRIKLRPLLAPHLLAPPSPFGAFLLFSFHPFSHVSVLALWDEQWPSKFNRVPAQPPQLAQPTVLPTTSIPALIRL